MSQSSFLFAVLLAAFVLFVAANDRLRTYLGVLWGKGTASPKPTSGSSGGGGKLVPGFDINDVGTALQIAGAAGGL